MRLTVDDWIFDVDIEATMAYSYKEAAEHCTCGYCRNYYKAVDRAYPSLRGFLTQFGVDIEAPQQSYPMEPTLLIADYCIKGTISRFGSGSIVIDGVSVEPEVADDHGISLSVGPMELPWVLDEPMEEVCSPANDPSFLPLIWETFLKRSGSTGIRS